MPWKKEFDKEERIGSFEYMHSKRVYECLEGWLPYIKFMFRGKEVHRWTPAREEFDASEPIMIISKDKPPGIYGMTFRNPKAGWDDYIWVECNYFDKSWPYNFAKLVEKYSNIVPQSEQRTIFDLAVKPRLLGKIKPGPTGFVGLWHNVDYEDKYALDLPLTFLSSLFSSIPLPKTGDFPTADELEYHYLRYVEEKDFLVVYERFFNTLLKQIQTKGTHLKSEEYY